MNTEELHNKLTSEIEHFTWSGQTQLSIELSERLEGQINISEALINAFYAVPRNKEINYDFERFNFKISITSDFEDLRIDNRFPNEVIIDGCRGKVVQISRYLTDDINYEKLLVLRILDSAIENVMIIGNIHRLMTRGLKDCVKFEINQINNIGILPNIYSVRGAIQKIHLLGVSAEHMIVEIEPQAGIFTEVKVKVPQIAKFDISSHAEWDLSIYDEGEIGSLKISSERKIRSIGINSIILRESQINLITSDCGLVKFTEVRSIEFLRILCDESILDCSIESIIFSNCSLQKTFNGKFSNFDVKDNVAFEHFINYGDFSFEYINLKGRMICLNSVLGKFILFNSNIGDVLDLDGSSIEDVKFLGTRMPESIMVDGLLSGKFVETKQIEGYRQLKLISEKVGNREQASLYRSKELSTHFKSLGLWKNLADKSVLFLNGFSNNHGMNWIRPALLIFLIAGPIMFSAFIWSLGYKANISSDGLKTLKVLWRNYLDFLIPGYLYPSKDKFSFLNELESGKYTTFGSLSHCTKLIVFINDIIVMPYLIVQLITAFRKHGGK